MTTQKFDYAEAKEVAQGTYGQILQSVQRNKDTQKPIRIVAIKQVAFREQNERQPQPQDPVHEAGIMMKLNHPNIMPCLDFFKKENLYHIVMPFCPLSLADIIYQPQFSFLPLKLKKYLVLQTFSAVQFLHQTGYIHRDIKPANLLLDKNGQVMLADFGQAIEFEKRPEINVTGTRNYRAPESVLGGNYGLAADIYQLGCFVFELFTQRQLFTSQTDIELITQQNFLLGPFEQAETLRQSADFEKIVLENGFNLQENFIKMASQLIADIDIIGFLAQLLSPEPSRRPTAEQVLDCEFLQDVGDGTVAALQRWLRRFG